MCQAKSWSVLIVCAIGFSAWGVEHASAFQPPVYQRYGPGYGPVQPYGPTTADVQAFEQSVAQGGHPVGQPPRGGAWVQRPYPYHLDYYKMKYGGSYAPYFGNLYGPPAVYAPTNMNVPPAVYAPSNFNVTPQAQPFYGPTYSAPQYGAPQYGAPQYGAPPQYGGYNW